MKLNQHVEIDDQFLTGGEANTLAGRPQSYREKQVGMFKAKPGVKLVGHIYKRCRQAEETCKAGRETSRQAEESEASIDLVGLQEIWWSQWKNLVGQTEESEASIDLVGLQEIWWSQWKNLVGQIGAKMAGMPIGVHPVMTTGAVART